MGKYAENDIVLIDFAKFDNTYNTLIKEKFNFLYCYGMVDKHFDNSENYIILVKIQDYITGIMVPESAIVGKLNVEVIKDLINFKKG